jgi:hypothetical protein
LAALNAKSENDDEEDNTSFNLFLENMPEPDVAIDNNNIYVKRTWLQQLLSRKQQMPEKKIVVLTEAERAKKLKRLKRMEEERQKTLKAMKRRASQKKSDKRNDDMVIFL